MGVLFFHLSCGQIEYGVLAKPRVYVPPRYHTESEYQKGETITMKIPFRGYPHPTARWTKDGTVIEQGGRFKMEITDRFAILTISDCQREDTGAYRLVVENELGSDSCTIKNLIAGNFT